MAEPTPIEHQRGNVDPTPSRTTDGGRRRSAVLKWAVAGIGLSVDAIAPAARAADAAYSTDAASGLFSNSFTPGTNTPTPGGTSSPASGDTLYFGAATTPAVSNDLAGATFNGINFITGAPAYTLTGQAFTLTGGISNASASAQTINNAINVSGVNAVTLASTNLTLGGNLTGSGTIDQTGALTGVTGVFNQDNLFSTRTAFATASAGSAAAAWAFNRNIGGGVALNFGNGTIHFGSLAGGAFVRSNNTGTTSVLSVGALGTSTTFAGSLQSNGTAQIALTKVGNGTLTLTGVNT